MKFTESIVYLLPVDLLRGQDQRWKDVFSRLEEVLYLFNVRLGSDLCRGVEANAVLVLLLRCRLGDQLQLVEEQPADAHDQETPSQNLWGGNKIISHM